MIQQLLTNVVGLMGVLFFSTFGCSSMDDSYTRKLPNYVCIDDPLCTNRHILRTPAKTVSFPLSSTIKQIVSDLELKFDNETSCAGLAAPQIGYGYRIIVFSCPDDPYLKKYRKDLIQTMPKTIWINPVFESISEETCVDWEGCFSIRDHIGPVKRYVKISYEAFTIGGKVVRGEASGFLARIIQHEVDHLNGKLCLDSVPLEDQKTRARHDSISSVFSVKNTKVFLFGSGAFCCLFLIWWLSASENANASTTL